MRSRIALAMILPMFMTACDDRGNGREPASSSGAPVSERQVDTSDPLEVAEAFFEAFEAGDIEGAALWVLPEQRQGFTAEMAGVDLALPDDYEVVVFTDNIRGEASIAGTDIEMDMRMEDGRWWIQR